MEAKTYMKRENARRAGVAAGMPAELAHPPKDNGFRLPPLKARSRGIGATLFPTNSVSLGLIYPARSSCHVAMPAKVISTEPTTCRPMEPAAQANCWRCSRVTISIEKVEKVERPPQKPVMMSSFHSGERLEVVAKYAVAKPMT